ncbi:hypothetical protein P9B03_02770 [Metasolibacillus meyeri]|uniref:ABC transporter permease n=1 Tax=Metasolibacillus meyeri TaxID=1071052 RepID=A0AAW9NLS3_9BACL|nr:hypothetical protein [Metasolibacillus meyeri]MEC1177396.1 hypothetical protein [Metasolibacillus meyeri]
MKSFVALLQKEWVLMRGNVLFLFISSLLAVFVLPYILSKNMEINMTTDEWTFLFLFYSILVGILFAPVQLFKSMQTEIKRKEVWLHSPQSIYKLLAAKVLFNLCTFLMFTFVILSSVFLLVVSQEWSIIKIVVASTVMTISLTCLQLLILIYMQVIYVCYLQLNYYIGKFAIIVAPLALLAGYLLTKFEESVLYRTLFQHGYISLEPLQQYLQLSDYPLLFIINSVYIGQLLFYGVLLAVLFMASSKWLEKVVTRS